MAVFIHSASSDTGIIDLHAKSPYSIIFRQYFLVVLDEEFLIIHIFGFLLHQTVFPDSSFAYNIGDQSYFNQLSDW